jgi:aminoglycoside phosphotransferase family enzyme
MPNTPTCPRDVSLDEKVTFLRHPAAYAARPANVDVIETHMSWVFLAGARVYKLKKPVRYAFLDFSTLEARWLDCRREVELNQRLAPDVYLRVVPLTAPGAAGLQLDGAGHVVEWLVEMRRLPADRMLDAAIRAATVRAGDIENVGRVLAAFYRSAARVDMDPGHYRARYARDIRDNEVELSRPGYGLAVAAIQALAASQHRFLERHAAVIEQRARDAKIVDAHGDLRPEHICLTPEPKIIDCLEFNRDFRLLDPVDELSYLAMECERLGDAPVGARLLTHYLGAAGDRVPDALVAFYKAFRAFLRARIAIAHIADHAVNDADKWRRRANEYLHLAESYVTLW